MPEARVWSAASDKTIRDMRAEGATWAMIGRTLGLSRNTIIERGRRLRAVALVRAVVVQEKPVSDDPNRLPLRAGHPITWGLLTDLPYPD
jgi:hypothetical protein